LRLGGGVFGLLLILVGAVWMGQGLGYIHGSFMTSVMLWFWIGLVCALVGLGLLVVTVRGRRTTE
jgi:hypothetical protein